MMFWVSAAVLTAVVTVALLWPLARRDRLAEGGFGDIEVYSDQLAEVERDLKNGLIQDGEAQYARAEIARRLLRAEKRNEGRAAPGVPALRRAACAAVVLVVPTLAMGTYLLAGQPGMDDMPLAARQLSPQSGEGSGAAQLIARAEDHLKDNPQDGRGWEVLAPIYLRLGRLEEARNAYSNAIRLLGPSADRQAGYGEVLTALAGGVVTQEARVAFQSAREMAPANAKAAFYLALALEQDNQDEQALAAFRRLADRSPPDAPWMPSVRERIAELDGRVPAITASGLPPLALMPEAGDEETSPPFGALGGDMPSADQIAAAGTMTPEARHAMIEDMVEGLAGRLRREPEDIEGWIRLVRSYGVLGDADKARDALDRGLSIFPPESEGGKRLVDVARRVGVDLETGEGER